MQGVPTGPDFWGQFSKHREQEPFSHEASSGTGSPEAKFYSGQITLPGERARKAFVTAAGRGGDAGVGVGGREGGCC